MRHACFRSKGGEAMKVCIKGAAEEVKVGDIDDVCLDVDRILLATDGSEPSVLATQYAVTLAKTFDASVKAIYVDTGAEALEYPEERMSDEVVRQPAPVDQGARHREDDGRAQRRPVSRSRSSKGGVAKRIIADRRGVRRRPHRPRRHRPHGPQALCARQRRRDGRQGVAHPGSRRQGRLVARIEGGVCMTDQACSAPSDTASHDQDVQHGEHIDTIESVDIVSSGRSAS